MEELDKDVVIDVFVGEEIIFHLNKDVAPDSEKVLAVLAKQKQKAKGKLEKDNTYVL